MGLLDKVSLAGMMDFEDTTDFEEVGFVSTMDFEILVSGFVKLHLSLEEWMKNAESLKK